MLYETIEVLAITEPYRLASTGSTGSIERILRRKLPTEAIPAALSRIGRCIDKIPILSDDFTSTLNQSAAFQRLSAVEGIDSGELILASIVLTSDRSEYMISGDKRFVAAISKNCQDDWKQLKPSFISFEICLRRIVEEYGFEFVVERTHEFRDCDETLRLAFGDKLDEPSLMQALESFDPCRG